MGLFDGTPLENAVLCTRCGQALKHCQCPPLEDDPAANSPSLPPDRQRLKVKVEKRRRGKLVTVISGFQGSQQELQQLLTELKNHCGAGGTVAAQTLEIQGDQQQRLTAVFASKGYR